MGRSKPLGELEHLVLIAVMRLRNDAYGMTIRQEIGEKANRDLSIGAVYTTLDRLEKKGLISSWVGESTPERGGRAKKYYKLTAPGSKALDDAWATLVRMRKGLRLVGVQA